MNIRQRVENDRGAVANDRVELLEVENAVLRVEVERLNTLVENDG